MAYAPCGLAVRIENCKFAVDGLPRNAIGLAVAAATASTSNSDTMKRLSASFRRKGPAIALTAVAATLLTAACSHSQLSRLVGADRDEHGCQTTAGYTWSNALHDCVRVWEVGTRFDDGPSALFLVMSRDSVYAEIFSPEKSPVLCRRVKGTLTWEAARGPERVTIGNDVITVHTSYFDYTRSLHP